MDALSSRSPRLIAGEAPAMNKIFSRRVALLSGAMAFMVAPQALSTQAASGCAVPQQVADGNVVVRCRRVTIEIERGADLKLGNSDQTGVGDDGALKSGAIYIEDSSNGKRNPFQIRTPDAIASVRGTRWTVDVSGTRTSVFVVAGSVAVRRKSSNQRVLLQAGDGVDVEPTVATLVVKQWSAARVEALLARFGR